MSVRYTLAVLAGSVVMLLVGSILYGVLFAGLFREGAIAGAGVMKQSPDFLWIIVGQLAFAVLLTLIISWRNATSIAAGMWTGAIVGFLMAIGYDFAQYGTTNLWTLTATLVDPFISAVLVGAGGGVMGFVLGRGQALVQSKEE